jgi:site-specific recombinase XerD
MIREWEATGRITTPEGTPNIVAAVDRFFEDAAFRGLKPSTITKYTVLLRKQLLPFCTMRGYKQLKHLGVQELRDFRGTWKDAPLAASKKLERLRSFFKFCLESKWVEENLARRIAMPKVNQKPTLPFAKEEMGRIWQATNAYPIKGIYGKANRDRILGFVMILATPASASATSRVSRKTA